MSGNEDAGCTAAIAGKPGSHRFCGVLTVGEQHRSRVGAGLPAKAVCQAMKMLDVPPPSRAGSLPQVLWCAHGW
ncbi:hypothetical protein DBR18_26640 [Pseudomonas sp. HMWF021]|nr:hypothetical protein DBR18_26640 [Pseudomonas sp. HMWF021]